MRYCNYQGRLSLVRDEHVLDVEKASSGWFSSDPAAVYANWGDFVAWTSSVTADGWKPLTWDGLRCPNPWPRQVFAIGLNYADHAAEGGHESPKFPPTFTKFQTSLAGPSAVVKLASDFVDWEVGFVTIIGVEAYRVPAAEAWSHVAGLTIGQDLSERVVQSRPPVPQFSLGKSFPGFGPVGPWVVTPDEFADPDDLGIRCAVNSEMMQDARTSDMIFGVPQLIESLSSVVPLLPGDLIFTGTPSGVGAAAKPPLFLRPGDKVESTIQGIGTMTTAFE